LIPAHVPAGKGQTAYRTRKAALQMNVLAACTFDLPFCYISPGWKGSKANSELIKIGLQEELLLGEGKRMLADGGFGQRDELLIPYRGVRYHLKEWAQAKKHNQKYVLYLFLHYADFYRSRNHMELFNLRHASARNAIECIFGVLKRRWPILGVGCKYSLNSQSRLFSGLACLYNIIQAWEHPGDEAYIDPKPPTDTNIYHGKISTDYGGSGPSKKRKRGITSGLPVSVGTKKGGGNIQRDIIARNMWDDELARRGPVTSEATVWADCAEFKFACRESSYVEFDRLVSRFEYKSLRLKYWQLGSDSYCGPLD
jgi:hypothetical protein